MTPEKVSSAFRATCLAARYGDPAGYVEVGKALVHHAVEKQTPTDLLLELIELLIARDDAAVQGWLRGHFPKHLRLIPEAGQAALLRGVYACLDDLDRLALKRVLAAYQLAERPKLLARPKRARRPGLHLLSPSLN